ncbi:hypothetical protein NKL07_01860 [Mesorhizobium sp. C280B]
MRPVTHLRGAESDQVGLGAAVGEAEHVDRREAAAEDPGKALFGLAQCGQAQSSRHGVVEGGIDAAVGMAEQAGSVFAAQVEIGVTINVPKPAALAARHGSRKGA